MKENASKLLSLLLLIGPVWSALHIGETRTQDHEIARLHEMEKLLYDAEKEDPVLICLWPGRYPAGLQCGPAPTLGNAKALPYYISTASDFRKSIKQYQKKWCVPIDLLRTNDCDLYSEVLADMDQNPTGLFLID